MDDVFNGWCEGLTANGVEVMPYNLGDRLTFYEQALLDNGSEVKRAFSREAAVGMAVNGVYSAAYRWWPDVILVVSGFFTTPDMLEVLRSRRHKVVILHTESPYEDDRQLSIAGGADLNLLNDPTNLDAFREVARTEYLGHAYRPEVHHPREAEADLRSEFCFVGTGYPSRVEFLEAVDFTDVDVALAGNWQGLTGDSPLRKYLAHDVEDCCDNGDAARMYASTKASVNLYRTEAHHPDLSSGWAMGPREVELAACGTFFLRDPRPESDETFPMLPSFTDPGDFAAKLRWWLAHDDARSEAARQARVAVADRTFTNHAARLLRWLDT